MALNEFDYSGKRVVLTGGSSGVGAAAVELLAGAGCTNLTVLDVNEPKGPATDFIPADMSDPASIDAAAATIGGGVDVLFNNAGVAGVHTPEFVLRVNYLGLRRLSEAMLPSMSRGGAIVNTASIAGQGWQANAAAITELISMPDWDAALEWIAGHGDVVDEKPYEFSKEVVQVWTMHSSRRSFHEFGVRTNSVCPGPVDTPLLVDFRRHMSEKLLDWTVVESGGTMLTPTDIAKVLLMLGTDGAAAINGHNLVADFGFCASLATNQLDFSALA